MAPTALATRMDWTTTMSISAAISFLIAVSLLLTVLVCCCGRGSKGKVKEDDERGRSKKKPRVRNRSRSPESAVLPEHDRHEERIRQLEFQLERERQRNMQLEQGAKRSFFQYLSEDTIREQPRRDIGILFEVPYEKDWLRLNPDDPYFCEDCAAVMGDAVKKWLEAIDPAIADRVAENYFRTEWWLRNRTRLVFPPRPRDYYKRSHLVYHEGEGRFDEECLREFAKRARDHCRKQTVADVRMTRIIPPSSCPFGQRGKPGAEPKRSPNAQLQQKISPAQANPYLFKSLDSGTEGFDGRQAQAPAASESKMRAAQRNPAYKTVYNVNSNVFEKPLGGAGYKFGGPPGRVGLGRNPGGYHPGYTDGAYGHPRSPPGYPAAAPPPQHGYRTI